MGPTIISEYWIGSSGSGEVYKYVLSASSLRNPVTAGNALFGLNVTVLIELVSSEAIFALLFVLILSEPLVINNPLQTYAACMNK